MIKLSTYFQFLTINIQITENEITVKLTRFVLSIKVQPNYRNAVFRYNKNSHKGWYIWQSSKWESEWILVALSIAGVKLKKAHSQESLTRLIDIAIENYGYVDLVDAIINDAVRHTKINVNDKDKEITVELTKTTDTKLNEIGKSLMREYSRQLKNSKRAKN